VGELRLHVAAGAFAAAESVLDRLMECSISPDDDFAQSELRTFRARIAIEKGDFAKAAAVFAHVQTIPLTYSPRRRAYSLALRLRIRLHEGVAGEELSSLVEELEVEHLQVRGFGGHDFEAHALFLGLSAVGDSKRATRLMREYVDNHRGSNWPVPSYIRQIVEDRQSMHPFVESGNGHVTPTLSGAD
jgi:hypothetical protein